MIIMMTTKTTKMMMMMMMIVRSFYHQQIQSLLLRLWCGYATDEKIDPLIYRTWDISADPKPLYSPITFRGSIIPLSLSCLPKWPWNNNNVAVKQQQVAAKQQLYPQINFLFPAIWDYFLYTYYYFNPIYML